MTPLVGYFYWVCLVKTGSLATASFIYPFMTYLALYRLTFLLALSTISALKADYCFLCLLCVGDALGKVNWRSAHFAACVANCDRRRNMSVIMFLHSLIQWCQTCGHFIL